MHSITVPNILSGKTACRWKKSRTIHQRVYSWYFISQWESCWSSEKSYWRFPWKNILRL